MNPLHDSEVSRDGKSFGVLLVPPKLVQVGDNCLDARLGMKCPVKR